VVMEVRHTVRVFVRHGGKAMEPETSWSIGNIGKFGLKVKGF